MTNDIIGQSKDHKNQVSEIGVMRKMPDTIENHEERITNLEDTMRVNAVQETKLTEEVNKKIIGFLEGKKSAAYRDNHIRGKAYSAINKDIRKAFGVRRKELPAKDFKKAVIFIQNWMIDSELKDEIFNANRQTSLFSVN
ncbi:ORF6C domain-containing protein [Streptococcus sp. ZY19097]|uniref:ORF6C domain-containing protein n=1 Tax=unclassified Streptococcus TaxID=2608887 RepID=UPI003457571F